MEIIKSGWASFPSLTLKQWNRIWLVLNETGKLSLYEDPDQESPREVKNLMEEVVAVFRGKGIRRRDVFQLKFSDCLIQLIAHNGDQVLLMRTDNDKEATAWSSAFDFIINKSRSSPANCNKRACESTSAVRTDANSKPTEPHSNATDSPYYGNRLIYRPYRPRTWMENNGVHRNRHL